METIDGVIGFRQRSNINTAKIAALPGEMVIALAEKCTVLRPLTGSGYFIFGLEVNAASYGALGDGSTHDAGHINDAISAVNSAGGGIVNLQPGKVFAVNAGTSPVLLKSNVYLNLNGSTIQRTGTNTTNNVVQNFTYAPNNGIDTNIGVGHGFIYGNATSVDATQSHASPSGNVFFFGVDGFVIENLKFDQSNGDNFGWRMSSNGFVNRITGGSFGRNLFSPTSGIGNFVTNCDFAFPGFPTASPGEYIDAESDGNEGFAERSQVNFHNMKTYGVTILDPWSNPAKTYVQMSATFTTLPAGGGADVGRTIVGATSGATGRNIALDTTALVIQIERLTGTSFIPGESFTTTGGSAAGTITAVGAVANQEFAHEMLFSQLNCLGNSPQSFRVMSAYPTVARRFIIGDDCAIGIEVNTAAALKIQNVSGGKTNALYLNTDPAGQGTSKAIWIAGNVYAVNASTGGRFYISGRSGANVMSKTVVITNTVTAGNETVVWASNTLTIAVQAGVSTVAQVLAATPTGSPWGDLSLHTAGTVAALASTAMSALPGWTQAYASDWSIGGRVGTDQFNSGIDAIDCPIKNSRITCEHLGDIHLREGSNNNRFNFSKLGNVELTESNENEFSGPITGGISLNNSASNDFIVGSGTNVAIDGTASINNRFRIDFKISGAKTFTNGATWIGQRFEREDGSFTVTMPGSSSGGSTVTSAWGRYNIVGDICHFSFKCVFEHNNGVGNQRIKLNIFPDGMPSTALFPFDGSTPSRWPLSIMANGFAFTGSQLVGLISGGTDTFAVYGLANTGTLTELPANLASGTYDAVSSFFRIR